MHGRRPWCALVCAVLASILGASLAGWLGRAAMPLAEPLAKRVAALLYWILPEGEAMTGSGLFPARHPVFPRAAAPPSCESTACLLLPDETTMQLAATHVAICMLVFAGYWRLGSPPVVREFLRGGASDRSLIVGGFADAIALSAFLGVLWPWSARLIWHVWWRFEDVSAAATGQYVPATNCIVNPDGYAAALGPAGWIGVVAGVVVLHITLVATCVRRTLVRGFRRSASDPVLCSTCCFEIDTLPVCPECGRAERVPLRDVHLSIGRSTRVRTRWILDIAVVVVLLFWPLVLGWIGRVLPESIWYRYIPF